MFKSYVVALAKVSPRNPGCFVPETGNSEASSPKPSLFTVCLSSESNVYWNQRKLTKGRWCRDPFAELCLWSTELCYIALHQNKSFPKKCGPIQSLKMKIKCQYWWLDKQWKALTINWVLLKQRLDPNRNFSGYEIKKRSNPVCVNM